MKANALRVVSVILILLAAIVAPVILSGYSELRKATTASAYIEVAEHYKAAAQRLVWRNDLYELAGHAYYHAKEYGSADAMYQIANDKNALSAKGWVAWGDVNYLNNDEVRAIEIWEQALEQKTISDDLYSRLAQIYQGRSDYTKAAEYLQKYVASHSDDAATHYRLGLLLTLSDPSTASTELITASQLDPQFDPAAQTLRAALNVASLNDSPSERLVIIGRGLGLVNEWDLARAAFESAVDADEKNAEAWAWLGEANQHTGREGSDELNRALDLNPNSSTVRGLRGLYFQRVSNHRAALTEFQAAASLEPENPARFVSLGDAYAFTGDLILALESFQYAVTLAPNDSTYWRALAVFCARNNVYVKEAGVPAAQQAVVLADDSENLDVLGWLLLLDGRYIEAEQTLSRALERDSQNASAHFHLGMLYLQTGDRLRAFEHLSLARDLGNREADAFLMQFFP